MRPICQFNKFGFRSDNPKTVLKKIYCNSASILYNFLGKLDIIALYIIKFKMCNNKYCIIIIDTCMQLMHSCSALSLESRHYK